MREEEGLGVDVFELDDIVVADHPAAPTFGEFLGREDLPEVVGVVVGVAGDLLAWRNQLKLVKLHGVMVQCTL
jgi:hypothetical protein